jgi:hypothetical protein
MSVTSRLSVWQRGLSGHADVSTENARSRAKDVIVAEGDVIEKRRINGPRLLSGDSDASYWTDIGLSRHCYGTVLDHNVLSHDPRSRSGSARSCQGRQLKNTDRIRVGSGRVALGNFTPTAFTDPCVNLSIHTALHSRGLSFARTNLLRAAQCAMPSNQELAECDAMRGV